MLQPELNSTATAELRVADKDLATAVKLEPDDRFPAVFATSRMIALMEVAAARLLRPCLGAGELSVGVSVDVLHTAATALGSIVKASAKFVGREEKLFVFQVSVSDESGEVGRGRHKRAIVVESRLVAGAEKRK